jgi:hypothetical protein
LNRKRLLRQRESTFRNKISLGFPYSRSKKSRGFRAVSLQFAPRGLKSSCIFAGHRLTSCSSRRRREQRAPELPR